MVFWQPTMTANPRPSTDRAHSTAEQDGKRLDVGNCIVFELKDGKVVDGREHFNDLYAWDEFWS
jgi:ketosteroid isomerase-like protein